MSTSSPADAPFVSTRGRAMATGMAVLAVVIFGVVGVLVGWSVGDRVSIVAFGVLFALGLLRWAGVRAEARPHGLWVRNLMLTRTVPWAEIVGVAFPDGDAFAHVDLEDGDRLSVMAIQRADGERSRTEAQRLADVISRHQKG